jgi:hypothetical protein
MVVFHHLEIMAAMFALKEGWWCRNRIATVCFVPLKSPVEFVGFTLFGQLLHFAVSVECKIA